MDSTQTMKQISNDLQAIINSLKQLTESVGNIVAAFDNIIGEQLPKPKARRSPVRKKSLSVTRLPTGGWDRSGVPKNLPRQFGMLPFSY